MPSIVRKKNWCSVEKTKINFTQISDFLSIYILLGCMHGVQNKFEKIAKMVPCWWTNHFNAWVSLES